MPFPLDRKRDCYRCLLFDNVQSAWQVNVFRMELAPNGECACFVGYKRNGFGFACFEYFLNAVCINRNTFADRRFVFHGDIYFGAFMHCDGFRFVQHVESTDVFYGDVFNVQFWDGGVISVDDNGEVFYSVLNGACGKQQSGD